MSGVIVHPTADVDSSARIGEGTIVWHLVQVRENAVVGSNCILGRGAYVGSGVQVGDGVKLQNYALVYEPAVVEDFCFIGPGAVITNDRFPRSTDPLGRLKSSDDWSPIAVRISVGASVGAGAVVLGGVTLGAWSMVGAGAVTIQDVPAHALVVGNPAHQIGWVGRYGTRLVEDRGGWVCLDTADRYREEAGGLHLVSAGVALGDPQV